MQTRSKSVKDLYEKSKANYERMFKSHLDDFEKSINDECKKGLYEANLFPTDYRENCNEPLDVVDDVVEYLRKKYEGLKIVMMDDHHHIIGDGFHYEASWDLEVVEMAEKAKEKAEAKKKNVAEAVEAGKAMGMVEAAARKLAEEAWDSKEYSEYSELEHVKWLAKEQAILDEEAARKLMYEGVPKVLPEVVVS